MQKVREAKEEMDRKGSKEWGITLRRFFLKSNESAVIRFFGDFEADEDPVISKRHFVKRLPRGQQYAACGQNASEGAHAGCVFCFLRDKKGDNGISRGSEVANFFVFDKRKFHVMEEEVRVLRPGVRSREPKATDYMMTRYPSCLSSEKRVCPYCKVNEYQESGFRHWELALTYADQLLSQQGELRDYCKCGARTEDGEGTIVCVEHECRGCKQDINLGKEAKRIVKCQGCGLTGEPAERKLGCSSCDNAQRCDLQDFWFKIRRSGSGTDTTYNFEAIHPCKPPGNEELDAAETLYPDWETVLAPEPAEMQAASLGVQSPFKTEGHGSVSYGDKQTEIPFGGDDDEVFTGAPVTVFAGVEPKKGVRAPTGEIRLSKKPSFQKRAKRG
jgi:hypothetical protein